MAETVDFHLTHKGESFHRGACRIETDYRSKQNVLVGTPIVVFLSCILSLSLFSFGVDQSYPRHVPFAGGKCILFWRCHMFIQIFARFLVYSDKHMDIMLTARAYAAWGQMSVDL